MAILYTSGPLVKLMEDVSSETGGTFIHLRSSECVRRFLAEVQAAAAWQRHLRTGSRLGSHEKPRGPRQERRQPVEIDPGRSAGSGLSGRKLGQVRPMTIL